MSSSRHNGALSPPLVTSRSAASSPRTKFPSEQLRPYMRKIINDVMANSSWDHGDPPRMSKYSKEISEKVKQRMVEIGPASLFKYIVTVTLSENLGQAGRADMSCHWEDCDLAVQEMFSNDTVILVCVAFALRAT